jgi:site-specific recombinase XerD
VLAGWSSRISPPTRVAGTGSFPSRNHRYAVTGCNRSRQPTLSSSLSHCITYYEATVESRAAVDTADPALFVDEARKPLTYRRWKRLLTDARTAAGVEVTSHSFRHFAASALISGGASVKQVQTFLGHASAVITLRTYAHMWPGDEDRTRNVLDAALSVLEHNPKIIRTVDGQ